jgi:hypothetical protein
MIRDVLSLTDIDGEYRLASNLWVKLRLLTDQVKKEVEDFDMYSVCEASGVLPVEEAMQELPGLLDELLGLGTL